MPLQKITVTVPQDLVEKADVRATSENSNRSKIVAAALQSYLVRQSKINDRTMEDDGMTAIRQDKITQLEREIQHRDDLLRAKDETIQRMVADTERYAQAREDEIKRYENIAGYYGTESSKIIDRLAGISETLSRLLPAAKTEEGVVEMPLPPADTEEPKQGFFSRFRRQR